MVDDLEYYESRARQEAEAAASSTVSEAAIVHRHLATRYEAQAFMLRTSVDPVFSAIEV